MFNVPHKYKKELKLIELYIIGVIQIYMFHFIIWNDLSAFQHIGSLLLQNWIEQLLFLIG